MKLIDNVRHLLADDLKAQVKPKSRLSIAASSFSIYAFEALRKELNSIEELRFIFTSPTFVQEKFEKQSREFYIPHIYNERHLCGGEFELRLRNELNQRAIAKECSRWVREKVKFKSNKHANLPLHTLIHVDNAGNNDAAYTNIGGFTSPDLGLTPKQGFPTLIQKTEYPDTAAYLDWFNEVWGDKDSLKEVTDQVQTYFESAFKDNSPEYLYYITLYNIFNDFLDDLTLDNLPNDEIGFKETVIWNQLFNFQKDAVIGAINKLEKYNGCILADSVGLGKTFSALGVIKYYEKRNKDVLVLCPKKLEANWNTYRYNDKNNIFAKDRFRYDVLFHTDLSRDSGMSNGRNLETVNWENYGLVVIDESHNFRNNNPNADRENRYQKLLRKVIKEGIETKVLMLSATPVNNRFNDLKNQLALAYEGNPVLIDSKLDTTQSIESVFRRAQQAFNVWSKLPTVDRTTEKLLETLDFDFFEVLDSLTIARSRKHITTYYDTADIGKFPKRNSPVSMQIPLSTTGALNYEDIANQLSLLNLSVYSPLNYLLPSKKMLYAEKYEKKVKSGSFSQLDREKSLLVLMRINLLKRLESSVDSFSITLQRVLDQISHNISLVKNASAELDSGADIDTANEKFDWEEEWDDEENVIGKRVKIRIADLDRTRWQEDLQADQFVLQDLLEKLQQVSGSCDEKLQSLIQHLSNKMENPSNEGNRKAIVFTAFADTAEYLYQQLKDHFQEKYGIHTALITGSTRKTNARNINTDLNSLLTCFSPLSKDKQLVMPQVKEEIDLIIATDCISEGQNLQDCDYLVNYDIHWNPVRIIQRFGRIDRIGSINSNITMVNYWPDISLDTYINLKQRVENKMLITNMTGTGDDNILNSDDKDLDYRKIQLRKLQEEVVDLEELREGVSITDLGLNDFRIDLANFIKEYGSLDNIPGGLHTITDSQGITPKGVIYVLKNINNDINIDKQNRLHPYYLIYMDDSGNVIHAHTDAKKTLDMMRLLCKNIKQPLKPLCDAFSNETKDYRKMDHYSSLLRQSIGSVINLEDQKEIFSLFRAGGTTALNGKIKGLEDFSLISFIVIK